MLLNTFIAIFYILLCFLSFLISNQFFISLPGFGCGSVDVFNLFFGPVLPHGLIQFPQFEFDFCKAYTSCSYCSTDGSSVITSVVLWSSAPSSTDSSLVSSYSSSGVSSYSLLGVLAIGLVRSSSPIMSVLYSSRFVVVHAHINVITF